MKLTYYGTAAAEGVPALFCDCDTCTRAREVGGKNVRTRSQALVDDKILIDLPADTYLHVLMYSLPLYKISSCIITHLHEDHLYPKELMMRKEGFAHLKEGKPFAVYGTQVVIDEIISLCGEERIEQMKADKEIELHTIEPFVPFFAEGYKITALEADHNAPQAVFYMVEKDSKALLYAHDTGLFPEKTWEYLEEAGVRFDAVSFDCTNVLLEWDNRGHMGLTGNDIVRKRLADMGLADENTVCVVNHFSHNGLAGYDELVPIAGAKGYEVSYDGMVVEF